MFSSPISNKQTLRLLNALNSEDRGLKVRFSLATIVFETFELIQCLKCYRRKGKTHLQTPILTIISAFRQPQGNITLRKVICSNLVSSDFGGNGMITRSVVTFKWSSRGRSVSNRKSGKN